ncbi:hypothetical protein FH972_020278 [Carpinus fangiana]|uniref:Uncharacterized protein n=1 Tax=Carpinus fangiana TaxID=176857 RepID=A0A5N6RX49_9ROSI|nr:hypothetical protein FH972_020278 [Carpinus fangiana]
MEGVGSRLGRASSRYGPAAAVFSGPVRKWKKRWVHVSQSYHSSHPQSNGGNSSRLVLCRWTPISSSSSTVADSGSAASAEEPPRRKFRYTPIAVLEEQSKAGIKKSEDEANMSQTNQSMKPKIDEVLKKGTQDSNASYLDLGLCLKGHNDNLDSVDESTESQMKSGSIDEEFFLKTN